MRYNPPPNWPKPPKGWAPHADWSPDPAWPPPPQGWRLWIEEEVPELGRLKHDGDDGEYFGDENAWADDAGPAPTDDEELDAAVAAAPPDPTEVAPEDLAVQHLGQYATVTWESDRQYAIGTIIAVSADPTAVRVTLDGVEAPISFPRETPGTPRLLVWM